MGVWKKHGPGVNFTARWLPYNLQSTTMKGEAPPPLVDQMELAAHHPTMAMARLPAPKTVQREALRRQVVAEVSQLSGDFGDRAPVSATTVSVSGAAFAREGRLRGLRY